MSGFAKKKIITTAAISAIIVAVGSLTYLFLWGKLFPYSPLKIGFSKHELSNIVVYLQHGAQFDDYAAIDSYPPEVEKWHEMRFRKKPAIFIFRDKDSYLRRSMTKARFCAYPNGSLVISPWALQEAKEGRISLEIYLKHELSHTLLYQHMGVLAAYVYYPRWLLEGIAVYSANQMGTSWYPGKKETYACIRRGNFIPPNDYATAKEDKAVLDVRYRIAFIYSEFGCIVDDLITVYGKERFLKYISKLSVDSNHDRVFRETFGIDFEVFLLEFRRRVRESACMDRTPGSGRYLIAAADPGAGQRAMKPMQN
jgi:hypothetical protein